MNSPQNCKLQFEYWRVGPIKLQGKLVLINEFNEKSTFRFMKWPYRSVPDLLLVALRIGVFLKAINKLFESPAVFSNMQAFVLQNPIIGPALFLISGLAFAELAVNAAPGKFKRSKKVPNDQYIAEDSFDITKEEYGELYKKIKNKTHYYSATFNNCVQRTRREFKLLKQGIEQQRASAHPS